MKKILKTPIKLDPLSKFAGKKSIIFSIAWLLYQINTHTCKNEKQICTHLLLLLYRARCRG